MKNHKSKHWILQEGLKKDFDLGLTFSHSKKDEWWLPTVSKRFLLELSSLIKKVIKQK